MSQCVFCNIARGAIPSHKVYEDDYMVSFLDIGPLAKGHLLLIPKKHIESIWDADAETVRRLFGQIPKLAQAVMKVSGAEGLNILQNNGRAAGQVVEHLHIHLIPRRHGDGLGYRWNAGTYARGEIEKVTEAVTSALKETSQ